MSLTDQNSVDFVTKARDYRERINLLISRSEFRKYYDGCEVLGKTKIICVGQLYNSISLKLSSRRLDL